MHINNVCMWRCVVCVWCSIFLPTRQSQIHAIFVICVCTYDGEVSHSLLNYINTTKCAYNANSREHFQLYLILPSMFAKNHSTIQMFIIEYGLLNTTQSSCLKSWLYATYHNICPHIHSNIVVQFKLMLFKLNE